MREATMVEATSPHFQKSIDNIDTVTVGAFTALVFEAVGPIAVEYMFYGCSDCRKMEPRLREVAEILRSELKIVRVNAAVVQELADQCEIQGTPAFLMFMNGCVVGRAEEPIPTMSSVRAVLTEPFNIQ